MDGTELLNAHFAAEVGPQLEILGFVDYEVKVQVRATASPDLRFVDPTVRFSLPMPQTVLQLRTFARSLHFKYLKEEDGRVIGTTYVLAASSKEKPLGVVDAVVAADIQQKAVLLAESIPDLPGKPRIDSPMLNDRNYAEVIQDAELQRSLIAKYGGIEMRRKTGPEERSIEECLKIVEKWRKWKGRWSQQEFADHHLLGSRKVLSTCIRRCRDAFGENFI